MKIEPRRKPYGTWLKGSIFRDLHSEQATLDSMDLMGDFGLQPGEQGVTVRVRVERVDLATVPAPKRALTPIEKMVDEACGVAKRRKA